MLSIISDAFFGLAKQDQLLKGNKIGCFQQMRQSEAMPRTFDA
jgi:hypothetical protein